MLFCEEIGFVTPFDNKNIEGYFSLHYLCSIRLAVCVMLISRNFAHASEEIFQFSIPSQKADQALIVYAKITNLDVIYSFDTISQYQADEVSGLFSAEKAIEKLLENTPLVVTKSARGSLIVKVKEPAAKVSTVEKVVKSVRRIEEILVSAQKRTEALIDVPVAITVLTSEQLDRGFKNSLVDVAALIPSLSLRKGNTNRNSSIFLRGLGTTSFSIAAEPSVSTVVDGVVLARSGQAFTWYDELERIEVLRGPQGTIFGKNASAGVINIVTKRPSGVSSGSVGLSYFEGGEAAAKINYTGPIGDNWAGKISGFVSDYDGPHVNTFNDERINGHSRKAVRGLLDYSGKAFDAQLSLGWFRSADNCCIELTSASTVNVEDTIESLRSVSHDLSSETLDTSIGGSANLTWIIGDHQLISISAYRKWENTEIADRDFSAGVENLFQSEAGDFQLHEMGFQKFSQISQEFRFSSNDLSDFRYTLGAFFLDVDADRDFTRDDVLCVETSLDDESCRPSQSRFLSPSARADLTSSFRSYALFGEGGYKLSDHLSLSSGFRWTSDEVAFTHQRIANADQQLLISEFGFGAPGIRDEDFSASDSQRATDVSGKLGVQYAVSNQVMAYATYATGFKGPAFDVSFSLNAQRLGRVEPEKSKSFEFGFKGLFYDQRLYAAFNAYYTELDGFQTNNIQVLNNNITSNFTNVGLVVNSGLEFDFMARLSKELKLFGGVAYLNKANIDENACDDSANRSGCGTLLRGRLPLAPRLKVVLGADYHAPLTSGTQMNFSVNYSYRSDMFSDNGQDLLERLDAVGLVDMSVGIADYQSTHSLNFIVNNVTNQHFADQIICCAANGTGELLRFQIPRGADRYLGLEYKYSF
ncbi:MAG: iron complex outermembrane receptor protein [Cellvibrionaceae bacterium]|jgi:iron complex outermembrane receptor protein